MCPLTLKCEQNSPQGNQSQIKVSHVEFQPQSLTSHLLKAGQGLPHLEETVGALLPFASPKNTKTMLLGKMSEQLFCLFGRY